MTPYNIEINKDVLVSEFVEKIIEESQIKRSKIIKINIVDTTVLLIKYSSIHGISERTYLLDNEDKMKLKDILLNKKVHSAKVELSEGDEVFTIDVEYSDKLANYLIPAKYPIITLCGSTKFKDKFLEVQKELSLNGNIVLSVGLFGHSGDDEAWNNKKMLDDMHKRKILMSEAIYVINVGGYIGESTASEIEFAKVNGKHIIYLEDPNNL